MRILVTGCAGRLGKAAYADLLAHGMTVRGLDLRPAEQDGGMEFHTCDLTANTASASLATLLEGVDAVLHMAAIPVPVSLTRSPPARSMPSATTSAACLSNWTTCP